MKQVSFKIKRKVKVKMNNPSWYYPRCSLLAGHFHTSPKHGPSTNVGTTPFLQKFSQLDQFQRDLFDQVRK